MAGLIISNTALHNHGYRLWSQLEHGRSAVCFPALNLHTDKAQYQPNTVAAQWTVPGHITSAAPQKFLEAKR